MDKTQVLEVIGRQIAWLGQSAFRITTRSGKVLYIDPFRVPPNSPQADFIFLTHSHGDHFNPRVVKSLVGPNTKVIAHSDMAAVATDVIAVGDEKDFGAVRVKAYHSYNRRNFPHPFNKRWLGFLLTFDDFTLYHAGDTDSVKEIAGMKPDLALLPMMGFATFGIAEGVVAAHQVGAVVTAPIHYGLIPGTARNGEKFATAYRGVSAILKKE